MSKKLIILSPQLGIRPGSNSGGEVYDRELIKAFCQQGIKVIVILPKNKPYLPHKNLKVYYLPFPFVWPPYLFNLLIIPWLFWLYKKEKFKLLRVHSPYFVGLGALFFRFFHPHVPLVVTYHHLEEKKPFFNIINKLFILKWDVIIADSLFTKKEIISNYKINPKKIHVVYAGVSQKFKPRKKTQKLIQKYISGRTKILLFLGELKPRKNVGFLLDVMSKLKLAKVKLLICGKGSLYRKLVGQVTRLKIQDKVVFTGYIPESQKVAFYNLADVFLFPSRKEGFGMPVIEAAACAVPAVATNTSSLKELIITGKTGYLAEFNDLNDWKVKIEGLLNNNIFRKKMGQSARKFSQNFSWAKTVKKQIEIYEKILKIRD